MNTMKKILSAGIFCALFSWPVQGMAQTQQAKDKTATANTHVTVNGGSVGNVSVEYKGANTSVLDDKNAQRVVKNHAAGVTNALDKKVDEALAKDAAEQRAAAQDKNNNSQSSSSSPNNKGQ